MHLRHNHCKLDLTAVCISALHYGIQLVRNIAFPMRCQKGEIIHMYPCVTISRPVIR